MSIRFGDNIFQDWLALYQDKQLQKRLERLMKESERDPFSSFAKAEPLKGDRPLLWCWD
ncbi:hypothetical protein FACS1894170_02030 [Planctomycetales bacterium]|nr:hypothetical protein FACS1894170_02030 [Planctomycetales bacterium]